MKRYMAGHAVPGTRVQELAAPDVRAIRDAAQISQSQFARLIVVNLRTLQDWEQQRTRPTGPARALLKIVASNPKSTIEALHAESVASIAKSIYDSPLEVKCVDGIGVAERRHFDGKRRGAPIYPVWPAVSWSPRW